MRMTKGSRLGLRVQNTLFTLLLVTAIVTLAGLSVRFHYRADWTAGGRNTLSQPSAGLVVKLSGPVHVTAYARETELLRRRIVDLIGRYQRYKDDIELAFVNPDAVPDEIRELGITVDGELLVEYGGRTEAVRELSEQAVTNALFRLARTGERLVLFMEGHGERDPFGDAGYDLQRWAEQLQSIGFTVQRINLARTPVLPDNAAVVVIASPRGGYLAGEVASITDFLARGGSLLWLDDPGAPPGLEALAKELGVAFVPGVVVDPTVSQVGAALFGTNDPRVALVAAQGLPPVAPEFAYNLLFPIAGGVELAPADSWRGKPLLTTLSNAWLEVGETIGQVKFDPEQDRSGPIDIGVVLTRARPITAGIAPAEQSGEQEQRVAVIGDADFLSNNFLGAAGNLRLGLALINWLARDDAFIEIPSRAAADSRLEWSQSRATLIAATFLLVLPAALFGAGVVIWYRRRRR